MKYFEIESGIVVNAIVASAEFINTLEGTYVESQKEFGIGDTYDGTSFSKAPVEPIDIALVEKTERKWRNDLVEKEEFEVRILQAYMPEPLSLEDVEKEIDSAIKAIDANSMKDMGLVTNAVKLKVSGRANMAEVSQKIKEKLTNA